MIERIHIDTFVKVLGDNKTGTSKPVQVIGSNGKDYLLKNQNVNEGNQWIVWDSMFMHEVLVHQIARYLNITVPNCAIANVENIFLQKAPALTFAHRYYPGYHFASNVIEGLENNLVDSYLQLMQLGKSHIKRSWNNFFNGVTNKHEIPRIIVLDILTANFDRFGNIGNLLIAAHNGERNVYCIDHGHCFYGPSWNDLSKKSMMMSVAPTNTYLKEWTQCLYQSSMAPMSGLGEIFRALDQHIDISDINNHCFKEVVHRAEQITPQLIDSWFSEIPDEWFVEKTNQISLYKGFLLSQKDLIRSCITIMAKNKAFNSYLGGDLTWNVRPTGTP